MQAYENGLKSKDTRFLLKPDSSFFRYFNNPSGATLPSPAGPAPGGPQTSSGAAAPPVAAAR
jgi:membrane protease subunit HflC